MKKYFPVSFLLFLLLAGSAFLFIRSVEITEKENPGEEKDLLAPSEHFYMQRSYPDAEFDYKGYEQSLTLAKQLAEQNTGDTRSSSWITEGPGNLGGRINVIAVHPQNQNIIFAGSAVGGIFKTTNGGGSWIPVFDNQLYLAMGSIVFDPANPNIMYAGTGDPNITGYPFIGNGIYKSTDGGNTWNHLGLSAQKIVSKIIVDPTNSNVVYAATMGLPFVQDTNRGLYKSTDGGQTWNNILFISDSAGVIDLLINPSNPQVLYAAGWNRIKNSQRNVTWGPAAKIYKTTDGGQTWNILTGGLPQFNMSRIGLAMSGTNPDIVFAILIDTTNHLQGIYKTINAGTIWTPVPTSNLSPVYGGSGSYFGKIAVHPSNNNQIYALSVDLHVTYDGGLTWQLAAPDWWTYEVHADKHAFVFLNSTSFLLGTDGGIYKTVDSGTLWTDFENIPNTQFYRIALNPHQPGQYSGGSQDNGTTRGNYFNINNWPRTFGGDGFQPVYNPSDQWEMWCEIQNGGIWISTDGGFSFNPGTNGIDPSDRTNWDTPLIMSSGNYNKLYTGTYRVYRNLSGDSPTWVPISSDLTDGVIFGNGYHTISALAESPVNNIFLYAGTSDANVWRSLNGGGLWTNVTSTLPDRYVTSVKTSTVSAATVYVTHSGYKYNDFTPHIHKSTDNGNTWTPISSDLPQGAVNDIVPFPGNDTVLFAATDAGVYFTVNAGVNWFRLGNNMPILPVYDIEYDALGQKLIAGTHARSIMSISIDSVLTGTSIHLAKEPFHFSVHYSHDMNSLHLKINEAEPGTYMLKLFSISGALLGEVPLQVNISMFEAQVPLPVLTNGIYVAVLAGKENLAAEKFILSR